MQNENTDSINVLEDTWQTIRSILIFFLNLCQLLCGILYFFLERFVAEIMATEQMFLLMKNLYAFLCQFFFFTLCDIALLKPEYKHKRGKVVSGLTTLLLYSIFTYFATKIRDTFNSTLDRTRNPNSTQTLIIRVAKVILEFAKAAIAILCLREQGLHYHFDLIYSSTTFIYYLCTERIFIESFIYLARMMNFAQFDTLEHLYVPIILHVCSISITIIVVAYLLSLGKHILYILLSSYFTLYLPVKNVIWNYLNPLILEQKTYASFKVATDNQLSHWNDICAICLETMSRARITPCNHLFHPHCLKRCLQTSMQCPLCKKNFISGQ